ncbi:MAG: glycoside hydrolase family 2 TIM barrel-domain containing protein, partial [bacterium]
GRILLNGKEIKLDGVSYFPDPAADPPRAISNMRADLQAIKWMGFNAVRFFPSPPPAAALDMCDRLGLLALLELPAARLPASLLADEEAARAVERGLYSAIQKHGTRPSVAMWGLGDGLPVGSRQAEEFLERMVHLVETTDSRPLYVWTERPPAGLRLPGGGAGGESAVAALRLDGPGGTDFGALSRLRIPEDGGLIITSYGAEAVAGRRGGRSPAGGQSPAGGRGGRWSEEAQLADMKKARAALSKRKKLDGWFFHSFADYPDPAAHFGPVPYMRISGLVARNRTPKLAFEHLAPAGLKMEIAAAGGLAAAAPPKPASHSFEAAAIVLLLPLCLLLWAAGGGLRGVLLGSLGPDFALRRNLPVESSAHVVSWMALGETHSVEDDVSAARRLQPAPSLLILIPVAAAVSVCARAVVTGSDFGAVVPDVAIRHAVEIFTSPLGAFHAAVAVVAVPLLLSAALSALLLRASPGLLVIIHARTLAPFVFVPLALLHPGFIPAAFLIAALWHLILVSRTLSRVFGLGLPGAVAMVAACPFAVGAALGMTEYFLL